MKPARNPQASNANGTTPVVASDATVASAVTVNAGTVASVVGAALATAFETPAFETTAVVSPQYQRVNAGYLGTTSPRSLAVTSAPAGVKGDETLVRFGRAFRRSVATGDATSPRMVAVVSKRSPLAVYTATRHEIIRRVYGFERERELAIIRKGEIRDNAATAISTDRRDRNRPEAKGKRSSAVFASHVVAPSKGRQHATALPCAVAGYGDVCNATSPRFNATAARVVAARRAARKLAKSIDRLAARFGAALVVAVKGDVATFARAVRFAASPVARASMRTAYRAHVASMTAPFASADLTALASRSGVPTVAPRLPTLSLVKVPKLAQRLASAAQRLASITARQGVKGVMPE